MRLQKWSEVEGCEGAIRIPIPIKHSHGFVEVYQSVEEMRQDYPGENQFMEISEVTLEDSYKQLPLPL